MSEILRMNLVGLDLVFYSRIKALAERTMREFDGAPEKVPDFQEAQRILAAMADIEQEAEIMAKGSEGGSGAHEGKGSSDGKGKGGYDGKHEAGGKDGGKDDKK